MHSVGGKPTLIARRSRWTASATLRSRGSRCSSPLSASSDPSFVGMHA